MISGNIEERVIVIILGIQGPKSVFCSFPLPLVCFDVVFLDILKVASQVILQGGHHAAVFVNQLGGSGLRCKPVDHC